MSANNLLYAEAAQVAEDLALAAKLRKNGDRLMPEYAAVSSGHWYNNGGRNERDHARLLRAAAETIERLTDRTNGETERVQWEDIQP